MVNQVGKQEIRVQMFSEAVSQWSQPSPSYVPTHTTRPTGQLFCACVSLLFGDMQAVWPKTIILILYFLPFWVSIIFTKYGWFIKSRFRDFYLIISLAQTALQLLDLPSTGIFCFIVLNFIVLHRHCIFLQTEDKTLRKQKITTCFYCDTHFIIMVWN